MADNSDELLQTYARYKKECDDDKVNRLDQNRVNREAYQELQDWSNKIAGQSTEFLPKTSTSIETFAAYIKRSLLQFGDWFSVDYTPVDSNSKIDGFVIRRLLKHYLSSLPTTDNKEIPVETLISDAVKIGLLESLIIIKVHSDRVPVDSTDDKSPLRFRLKVDLVPFESYSLDPTGRGLFEIHETERDYFQVKEWADRGIYSKKAVDSIAKSSFKEIEQARMQRERGGSGARLKSSRFPVKVSEVWGTILDGEGNKVASNSVYSVANEKYILRKLMDNPFWHKMSPFVVTPIIRVPHTVWHKAVYDTGSKLNLAINELFNLMVDGGIAAVWGIRQIRDNMLRDQSQIEGGLPAATTLRVKDELPPGVPVVEQVATGNVPQEALAMYSLLDAEFNAAVFTNDIKLGQLPSRTVKATEVVEASQSQAITLDGIVSDLENSLITNVLTKAWLILLQFSDELDMADVVSVIGQGPAEEFASMTPRQRFDLLGKSARFKVYGLSATLNRVKDFQKLVGILDLVTKSPLLAQVAAQRFNVGKIMDELFRLTNLDPSKFYNSVSESQQASMMLQQLAQQAGVAGPGGPTTTTNPELRLVGSEEGPGPIGTPQSPNTSGLSQFGSGV